MSLVEVTPEERARVERLRPELDRAERRWMECLGEPEERALLGMLARLQANGPPP